MLNKLHEESVVLGKFSTIESQLEIKNKECEQLTEACGKLAGALEFTIAVLSKLAEEGSELAKACLESLNEQTKAEELGCEFDSKAKEFKVKAKEETKKEGK